MHFEERDCIDCLTRTQSRKESCSYCSNHQPSEKQEEDLKYITRKRPKPKKPEGRKLGRWTDQEHELFLEALKLYGKDWEEIQAHVGTRDIVNVRAHAQKFL